MPLAPEKIGTLVFTGAAESSEFLLANGVSGPTARGYKDRSMGVLVPALAGTKVTLKIEGDVGGFVALHTGMPSVVVEVLESTFLPLGFLPFGKKLRADSDAAEIAGPVIELWLV